MPLTTAEWQKTWSKKTNWASGTWFLERIEETECTVNEVWRFIGPTPDEGDEAGRHVPREEGAEEEQALGREDKQGGGEEGDEGDEGDEEDEDDEGDEGVEGDEEEGLIGADLTRPFPSERPAAGDARRRSARERPAAGEGSSSLRRRVPPSVPSRP